MADAPLDPLALKALIDSGLTEADARARLRAHRSFVMFGDTPMVDQHGKRVPEPPSPSIDDLYPHHRPHALT